ncbi:hypothetical protein [Halorubrum ezzemoulense]|uniref:hypothetical protein n=1 Tax=Halorubrum ezzemoulense TaxID=337243 RepID=UPI00159580FC|nr:hypothetical protein [Halorubrum ezzemoulense]
MIEQLIQNPLVEVILAALFLAGFVIAATRNSGSDDDEDENDRSEKSQQARDRDE